LTPLMLLLALSLGWVAGEAGQRARDSRSLVADDDVAYLPTAAAIRFMSAGYDDVAADILWLRTVTYYGEWRQGDHGIEFFRELSRRVVELDPHFVEAYRFSALVLADDLGAFDDGIDILRRGMQVMPDTWWLPFEAGFLEYTVRLDNEKAARWFRIAASKPDAPDRAKNFAAFVTSRAGDLKVSLELWKFVANTTKNPEVRIKAEAYIEELQAAVDGTGPVPEWVTRRRIIGGRSDGDV
ncbi:hypothetical protein DRQ32_10790, partial [bacterium]